MKLMKKKKKRSFLSCRTIKGNKIDFGGGEEGKDGLELWSGGVNFFYLGLPRLHLDKYNFDFYRFCLKTIFCP